MTEKNSNLSTIEKIKSFAIAVVGSGIFSMGTTYFSEQSEYRVPRILLPVYEIFGNIGLAVGMMILGAALIYYAYRTFTKNGGKSIFILGFTVLAIIAFYSIIKMTNSTSNSPQEVKAGLEENQRKTQEQIANTDRPTIDNAAANQYLNNLEALEKKYEKSVTEKNKNRFDECEKQYETLISADFSKAAQEIATTPAYRDFAMYNAKVLERIQVFRTHKW